MEGSAYPFVDGRVGLFAVVILAEVRKVSVGGILRRVQLPVSFTGNNTHLGDIFVKLNFLEIYGTV